MQVVQIRRKSETFNGTLDVLLDMRGGIVDLMIIPVTPEDVETTFRGDYPSLSQRPSYGKKYDNSPKTLSRTLCFRMKSPRSFSFTPF